MTYHTIPHQPGRVLGEQQDLGVQAFTHQALTQPPDHQQGCVLGQLQHEDLHHSGDIGPLHYYDGGRLSTKSALSENIVTDLTFELTMKLELRLTSKNEMSDISVGGPSVVSSSTSKCLNDSIRAFTFKLEVASSLAAALEIDSSVQYSQPGARECINLLQFYQHGCGSGNTSALVQ